MHLEFGPPGALIAAIALLAAAPPIFALGQRFKSILPFVNGFVFASIGALVVLLLAPPAIMEGGAAAVVAMMAGLGLPLMAERLDHYAGERGHALTLGAAFAGLMAHAAVDGMALTMPHEAGGHGLSLAVAVHRLPVGLAIWWLIRPAYGAFAAVAALALIAVSTVVGFVMGGAWLQILDGPGLAIFTAFVCGALMHVLAHRPHEAHAGPARWRFGETLGAVMGVGLVLVAPHDDPHGATFAWEAYGARFIDLALETAPALLLGYVLAGLVVGFLPKASVEWLKGGRPATQSLKGLIFGLPLPVCSCGVVPVYEGLIKKGVPTTAAMAFLIATPELGIDSLLLSLPLLGGELTAARFAAAAVMGLGVGWLVGRTIPPAAHHHAHHDHDAATKPLPQRLKGALKFGLVEVVDDTAPWIIIGLAIAAAIEPGTLSAFLTSLPPGLGVVLAALAGTPVYVCASGATPLAGALILAGLSPGAAIAFLLSGPATNVTTFGILSRLHGPATAWRFGATMLITAVALGLSVDLLLPAAAAGTAWQGGDHAPSLLQQVALAAITLLGAVSLLRQGPRAFVGNVIRLGDDHAHDHDSDPDHGESHDDHCCAH